MSQTIDFTNCKRLPGKAYNGANGKKIAVEYNGEPYMLKFPPSGENKPTDLSYTNSCVSEHIASSIFGMLDIRTQKTFLGTFHIGEKTKVVCACRDFTSDGKILYDFCSIKNTIIDSEHSGSGTELTDILETIEKQQFVNPSELLDHFWDMFVVDALLGNFDRHNGNWGFLYDPTTESSEIAPIYDCGSCLLPQADEAVMKKVLSDEAELNARIYQYPTSAIKLNERKIKYYDFITECGYTDCGHAISRMMPKILRLDLSGFIDQIPFITELQKNFYKKYIGARCERILLPTYEHLMSEAEQTGSPRFDM